MGAHFPLEPEANIQAARKIAASYLKITISVPQNCYPEITHEEKSLHKIVKEHFPDPEKEAKFWQELDQAKQQQTEGDFEPPKPYDPTLEQGQSSALNDQEKEAATNLTVCEIMDALKALANPEVKVFPEEALQKIKTTLRLAPTFIASKLITTASSDEVDTKPNHAMIVATARKINAGLYPNAPAQAAEYTREDFKNTRNNLTYVHEDCKSLNNALQLLFAAVTQVNKAFNGKLPDGPTNGYGR